MKMEWVGGVVMRLGKGNNYGCPFIRASDIRTAI